MTTIVAIRLCGSQSWGGPTNNHEFRTTEPHPTKSGITGLICNALGADRSDHETVREIAAAPMTIRIDKQGHYNRQIQTIQDVPLANDGTPRPIKSTRIHLDAACFLVLLAYHDHDTAYAVAGALERPRRPLFFGRKCFTAPRNICLGLHPVTTDPLYTIPPCHHHHTDEPVIITETMWNDPDATITYDVVHDFTHATPNTGRPVKILC
jgi:CRISPR system Cascade subunit CasD